MVGGGPFNLKPGEWTDDTSLALCLATSLIEKNGFDPVDQIERYCRWRDEGYLSSNGECFDIGNTTNTALDSFNSTGNPFSGPTEPTTAGNGSIMRLAPVPMVYRANMKDVVHYSAESSRTTHGAREAVDACRLFGKQIAMALTGESKEEILFHACDEVMQMDSLSSSIAGIASGDYRTKQDSEIVGSGYVVKSLEAALWCFFKTDNFKDAILKSVNLGDDADTTAAVCGQIAGAFYGMEGIPDEWLARLAKREMIEKMALELFQAKE
jgi:ADP-ribosyl-[dinitrogen reductase] hydrolase